MSRLFKNFFRKFLLKNSSPQAKNANKQREQNQHVYSSKELKQIMVSANLNDNIDLLKKTVGHNEDVVFRQFHLGIGNQAKAVVIYVEGMVNKAVLNNDIIKPLMLESRMASVKLSENNLPDLIKNFSVTVSAVKDSRIIGELVDNTLYGNVALIIDGYETALIMDIKEWPTRGLSEPDSEVLVRGPREGFTETLRNNFILIRRRLRSPNLMLEEFSIGSITSTAVAIVYIKGVADPALVEETKNRLQRIDIDGVLESGYLEEFIEDNPKSPFPQMIHTERPDRLVAALLEGRVGILTDGTPISLIVPSGFFAFMQSPEDFYERYILGSAIRFLRYIALVISLLLPSLYIAITTFHQEMIPTQLLISLVAARQGVPFPALVEALMMEFTFEALREAGIRLPRAVGQAVSIVGALVIGQAAVQAGVVSPMMVIVVAVTGIASFMNPSFNMAITLRVLRFPLMLLAATLGLFGVSVGLLIIIIHLAGLRSFGAPYLSPLAPFHSGDLKDTLVRAPWWAMDKRPTETVHSNSRRQARKQMPSSDKQGGQGKGNEQ